MNRAWTFEWDGKVFDLNGPDYDPMGVSYISTKQYKLDVARGEANWSPPDWWVMNDGDDFPLHPQQALIDSRAMPHPGQPKTRRAVIMDKKKAQCLWH